MYDTLCRYAEMILTTEAYNREVEGGIPLDRVKELTDEEISTVIPNRVKNCQIYEKLQKALDNEEGLESDEWGMFDPLAELGKKIVEGMTGFDSSAGYTDEEYAQIMNDFLPHDADEEQLLAPVGSGGAAAPAAATEG